MEECQVRALSTNRHSEGLLQPPSLKSLSPPQLQDVLVLVLRPMLVLSLLSLPKNHLGPYQISSSLWTDHHTYHKVGGLKVRLSAQVNVDILEYSGKEVVIRDYTSRTLATCDHVHHHQIPQMDSSSNKNGVYKECLIIRDLISVSILW